MTGGEMVLIASVKGKPLPCWVTHQLQGRLWENPLVAQTLVGSPCRVITGVESRYTALGYAGGTAQQQAAAAHTQAQAQDDWREDGAYRQRAGEAAAPWGYAGG
eukprot:CAMPEP_0171673468 /NCGR_PEP_ID=MMETSP0990-20121206/52605_1 /TAXON_ID=483369 /ORGANISM="non described non described, Strain CCMP2098" /LENGTH=103 /DNA_ID=CAMNT_0012258959 /DNA_START=301 /DNA_END=612 /DNA_ORIENTATION=-